MTRMHAVKFHTPPQDLAAPTLFAANLDALTNWLAALPKANLGQSARAVYHAINELNRVKLTPLLRLQLLETIRPAIHFAVGSLRRHYLNQPITLSEQAQKVARLAHELHEQLATGYVLIVVQVLALGKPGDSEQLQSILATAVHRGITEHTLNLLRDYQLYRNPHPGGWNAIHQLALAARERKLERIAIADAQCGDCSVHASYLRALLLGSAKSTQLRQDDLNKIFLQAIDWSTSIALIDYQNALLLVDPYSDEGPIYQQFAEPDDSWFGVETTALAHRLTQQLERTEAETSIVEQSFSADLLAHLAHNWGSVSTRAFLRTDVHDRVHIAVGLTAAHHFIAGEIDFNKLLNNMPVPTLTLQKENPFLSAQSHARATAHEKKDVWDIAYAPSARLAEMSVDGIDYHIREEQQKSEQKNLQKEREKYRHYTVERVNISAGGFCIGWPQNDPAQVRTGEIVGISEDQQQQWSIGVVRWLRLTEHGPQLGIQLLSPSAHPFGARVINKTGQEGDYLRALVLPEMKPTGQPTTLLVPRLPFRVGQKVSLLCRDRETRVQLIKKIASSPSFSLFEFRRLSGAKADLPETTVKVDTGSSGLSSGFDSLWDDL